MRYLDAYLHVTDDGDSLSADTNLDFTLLPLLIAG
jgi:hypothetical protein